MIILGPGAPSLHDSAAALLVDGKIAATGLAYEGSSHDHAATGPSRRSASRSPPNRPYIYSPGSLPGVVRQRPALRLLVAGRDKRRSDYEALARRLGLGDRVHFLGWRSSGPTTCLERSGPISW